MLSLTKHNQKSVFRIKINVKILKQNKKQSDQNQNQTQPKTQIKNNSPPNEEDKKFHIETSRIKIAVIVIQHNPELYTNKMSTEMFFDLIIKNSFKHDSS